MANEVLLDIPQRVVAEQAGLADVLGQAKHVLSRCPIPVLSHFEEGLFGVHKSARHKVPGDRILDHLLHSSDILAARRVVELLELLPDQSQLVGAGNVRVV